MGLLSFVCPLPLPSEHIAASTGIGDHGRMSTRESYRKGPVVLRGTQIPTQTTDARLLSSDADADRLPPRAPAEGRGRPPRRSHGRIPAL